MKTIIFHSYKGGTGKTTLALNTALKLAQKGYKTLLIDADFSSPTFDSIFVGVKHRFFNDFFECNLPRTNNAATDSTTTPPPRVEDLIAPSTIHDNLDLIFADPKPKFGKGLLSMDKEFHKAVLKKLYELITEFDQLGYDFVLMDTSPSLNLASINAIIIADAAILVLRPNKYGIAGTSFLLKELYNMLGTLNRKDYIVFNQVVPNTPKQLIAQWKKHFKKRFKVETIGVVHCNCAIALDMLYGKAFTHQTTPEFLVSIEAIVTRIAKDLRE